MRDNLLIEKVDNDFPDNLPMKPVMEEWEANPFSTLGFIVSVVVKVLISN